MKLMLSVMNFLAKYSTPKWNKVRPLRIACRKTYQSLARARSYAIAHWPEKITLPSICDKITQDEIVNTYPYPEGFAPWPEDDGIVEPGESAQGRGYAIIIDSMGFVVNRSTSYVAFKIYERTGRRLVRPDRETYHAKNWAKLLETNGFRKVSKLDVRSAKGSFVGIIVQDGEFGQVVWLEKTLVTYLHEGEIITQVCSTYRNFEFLLEYHDLGDEALIWYQIS